MINIEEIRKNINFINWENISCSDEKLSEDFIREFCNELDWLYISEYQTLSEDCIREFSNKVDWFNISLNQKLSEEFIREFQDKVYWEIISYSQILSEKFIREFKDKIHWDNVSYQQKLSEGFIREFQNKINWKYISRYQKLSEEFIGREFNNKIHWDIIIKYQKLSPEFIKEFNLIIPETCWLYKSKEFKEDYIRKNTDYEIINGKVIAYKSTLIDGTSVYDSKYKYEVGKEHINLNADYNINVKNSFGLSAWSKEEELRCYSKGKLFKVEIDIEDIAAITLYKNKIRATKIKILEEIDYD